MFFTQLLLASFSLGTLAQSLSKRAECSASAEGWEQIDDSPAINKAIIDCGNGGIIILPADQIYSIRSPIDLRPCQNCEIQIEGRLIVSQNDWVYWGTQASIFIANNIHGVTIRSVSGSGIIDGNAQNYYLRTRWMGYNEAPQFFHITNTSSDIHIDNLSIRNAPMHFFRINGFSSKLKFTSLNITVEGQTTRPPASEAENYGFELGDVTDVIIDNVNMHVRGLNDLFVGVCVALDSGTRNVLVKDMVCKGTWGGVLVMIGSFGAPVGIPGYNPTIWLRGPGVYDVLVQNLTVDSLVATGYRLAATDETIRNVTWDGVSIIGSGIVDGDRCYQRSHSTTGWFRICTANSWKTVFDNVSFKNYKGEKVGKPPSPEWGCAPNQILCDIKFSGWPES